MVSFLLTSLSLQFKLASVQIPSICTLASGGKDFALFFPKHNEIKHVNNSTSTEHSMSPKRIPAFQVSVL